MLMVGLVLLVLVVGIEFGRAEAASYCQPIVADLQDSIEGLLPPRVTYVVEEIEPGSREDLFNRADEGCELCEGRGLHNSRPCPCTQVEQTL